MLVDHPFLSRIGLMNDSLDGGAGAAVVEDDAAGGSGNGDDIGGAETAGVSIAGVSIAGATSISGLDGIPSCSGTEV